jgi:hypothetical protein
MGITYTEIEKGITGPVIECDICGERIIKCGNVLYPDYDRSKLVFVHKGTCDILFRESIEKQYNKSFSFVELDRFLYILFQNAGVKYDYAKDRFKDMVDLGFAFHGKGYEDLDVRKENIDVDKEIIEANVKELVKYLKKDDDE